MNNPQSRQALFHSGNLTDEQFDNRIIAFVMDGIKNDKIEAECAPEFINSLCKGTYRDIRNKIKRTARAIGVDESKITLLSLAVDSFCQ